MHGHDDHDHHDHDHPHHHHHDAAEVRAQPVVLDLGDGVGALIVHTDPELLGVEVEISPAGDDGDRQHKEVLRRALGPTSRHVLVYDNLRRATTRSGSTTMRSPVASTSRTGESPSTRSRVSRPRAGRARTARRRRARGR